MAVFRVRPTSYKYPVGLSVSAIANTNIDYLVVAGGGSGGNAGGGGGAGGYLAGSNLSLASQTNYAITVGAGGTKSAVNNSRGNNGNFSLFTPSAPANSFYYYAVAGGAGGGSGTGLETGLAGGSGGGGAAGYAGGNGVPGQGSNGATAQGPAPYRYGGGGGAGQAGGTNSPAPGSGGDGTTSSISGSPVTYAGGGGGGVGQSQPVSPGGSGGGGKGSTGPSFISAENGTPNTGGGGGGGASPSGDTSYTGNGGSGIVIIRYAGATQLATGGTVTTPSGYVVHTFTGDGTFATNANFGGTTTYSIN